MSNSEDLLRMLEPVVRPVALPGGGGGVAPRRVPLEEQSFESLLEAARGSVDAISGGEEMEPGEAGEPGEGVVKPRAAGPLGPLARVDAIENASLRALVGERVSSSGFRVSSS